MMDLDGVIESLLSPRRADPWPSRHVQRLDDGSYHLDYGDPDRVFLMNVREIPRTRLPLPQPNLPLR
jgi:hypothetical protein